MRGADRIVFLDRCTSYVEELKRSGHFVCGEVLQGPENAATVRPQGGKISIIAGPYTGTKDKSDAFIVIEAKDFNHAIRLISKHPSLQRGGTWEIIPTVR